MKLTKGDLFRYYVQAAPFVLPAVADRPLVMKRFPNGIGGEPFYQHRVTAPPPGVRVEDVREADGSARPQIIGGDLTTLLYMTQLASISQDPWFSRVGSPDTADYVALDLDPMPDVPFTQVLEVARWIRDELATLGADGFPKTSGADGAHIYIPLPPGTPYETGLLFCQIVASVVSQKHPKQATVERSVKLRGRRVYVDYLQNIPGKTLATAYSARASEYAGVSTPADVAGDRRGRGSRSVHDRVDARALQGGRRSLGGVSIVEGRRSRARDPVREETMIAIRPAAENDLADILRIYNQAIEKTTAVFEYRRPHHRHAARVVQGETGGVALPVLAAVESGRRRGRSPAMVHSARGRRTNTRSSSPCTWTNGRGDAASAPRWCGPSSTRRVRGTCTS